MGDNGPADGLWMDQSDRLCITAVEENAIKVRDGDDVNVLVQDDALRWPDTLAEGPHGSLYVTSSRIPDMSWFKPDQPNRLQTTLFRIAR